MRNLVTLNRGKIAPDSRTYPDLLVVDAVFDSVTDSITYVLSSLESGMIEVQQFMKTGEVHVLASFPAPVQQIKQENELEINILSFNHFVDTCQLIFVFKGGDIITATYDPAQPDPETTIVEIVGSIDVGLLASTWSPDEETLSIVTGELNVILLLRQFEPIHERKLNPKDVYISEEKHVSVGWGKKETQFTGKGMREKERERDLLRDPTVSVVEKGVLSDFDSQTVSISWRGDCEYFAISTIEPVLVDETQEKLHDRRVIRVFTRDGELDSVSEAVDGLEHNVSWKPQGSLIASTQRHLREDEDTGESYPALDLVFYERNGLRHGEFDTRLDPAEGRVLNLHWSCDLEVLAFQLDDRVQLWTTKNYHWYLKQEITVPEGILFLKFHSEKPLHLMIGSKAGKIEVIDLTTKITTGPTILGKDKGMVMVVDGSTMKLTPLAIANVPPPISFREIDIPSNGNITDIASGETNQIFAALSSNNEVHLVSMDLKSKTKQPKIIGQIERYNLIETEDEFAKQIAFAHDNLLAVVVDNTFGSRVVLFDVTDPTEPMIVDNHDVNSKVVLLKSQSDFEAIAFETIDGRVFQIGGIEDSTPKEITRFPQLCRDFELAFVENNDESIFVAFGISVNGKLFANDKQVASAVTSLKITESHILFTTAQSQLCFIHLKSADGNFEYDIFQQAQQAQLQQQQQQQLMDPKNHTNIAIDERMRMIERGSILISAMPSKYSVVLEAPRGNLETICPRIMVLSGVRKFIKALKYKEAFLACRTHRIDLDILHDYDPELFFNNLENFVNQIKQVEHLDLFVSCLHEEDVAKTKYRDTVDEANDDQALLESKVEQLMISQKLQSPSPAPAPPTQNTLKKMIINLRDESKDPSSKINRICEGILSVLVKPEYFSTYLQTIITAYACEKPANLEGALELISNIKDNEDHVDQTVTHLCFLQDINKIYNTALGLYNVKLALVIAQKSQKDPKEYLPFLQNLHVQDELRRKFLIDDFLKKYEKALSWLFEMGESAYDEFDDFVCQHDLYKIALSIYRYDNERSNAILQLYAADLNAKQQFAEAGLTFEYLGKWDEALENYILAKKWREALNIVQSDAHMEKLQSTCDKLISSLTEEHKYKDAAEIEFYFLGHIEEAVKLYCKSYCYEEAILLSNKEGRAELIADIVDVQLGEGFGVIAELLADCKSQINSQLRRLRELRQKKQEDPYSFYGIPNDDLDTPDNVSIAASETSTTPSFFTRYTGKTSGTAKTGVSRKSSKNRKREERKRAKGRKGTIYEEEYLIKSVGRLLERLDQTESDAVRLIEGLIRRHLKEQAYQIQKNWVELIDFLKENIVEIHNMSERDRERIDDNGEVYLMDEIPVPKIREFPKKATLDY